MSDRLLGQRLIANEVISEEQLRTALETQETSPKRIGAILVEQDSLKEEELRAQLAEHHHCKSVDLQEFTVDKAVADILPIDLIQQWEVIPMAAEGLQLHVAMTAPSDTKLLYDIEKASGYSEIKSYVVTSSAFSEWLNTHFERRPFLEDVNAEGAAAELRLARRGESEAQENELALNIVRYLVLETITRAGESTHLEPLQDVVHVRLRVAGQMTHILTYPKRLHGPIIEVLRARSALAATHGTCGIIDALHKETTTHFRLDLVATTHGEAATLKIAHKFRANLNQLGFTTTQIVALESAFKHEGGMVLIAGSRESGRTATLHALTKHFARPEDLTMAVGLTAESAALGIMTVLARGEQTLSQLIRTALRHNPDTLAIDAIDSPAALLETLNATMSGHRAFVCVPASRAIDAITQSGSPRYLMASSVRCSIAQRLLRKVCPHCAVGYDVNEETLAEFKITEKHAKSATFKRGKGCSHCLGTGYSGHIVLREMLVISPELQSAIRDEESGANLLEIARSQGFTTLWEEAVVAMMTGETTVEEVRATLMNLTPA